MTAATRPWRAFGLLLVLGLGLGVLPFARFVPDALATDPSLVVPGIRPLEPAHAPLSRQVYGYLPWWQLGPDTAGELQYDLLTTIAFFGIGIQPDGDLDRKSFGYYGYVSGNATAVTNAAHDHGVRVVPTFQLFDSGRLPDLKSFLAHTAAQKRFISQAIALMASRGADGANLDLEPLPDSLATRASQFVGRFRAALRARLPGATLVVAMPARARRERPSRHWPRSSTSSSSWPTTTGPWPRRRPGRWPRSTGLALSVQNDLARYLRHAAPGKLILGMPAYGYDWPVTSRAPKAVVRDDTAQYGSPFAVTFSRVSGWLADHPSIPVRYDPVSGSPYFTYHDHDRHVPPGLVRGRLQPRPQGRPRADQRDLRCRHLGARWQRRVRSALAAAARQAGGADPSGGRPRFSSTWRSRAAPWSPTSRPMSSTVGASPRRDRLAGPSATRRGTSWRRGQIG